MNARIAEARAQWEAAVQRMQDLADQLASLGSDASPEQVEAVETAFNEAEDESVRCKSNLDRLVRIHNARSAVIPDGEGEGQSAASGDGEEGSSESRSEPAPTRAVTVDETTLRSAQPRGAQRQLGGSRVTVGHEPLTYERDRHDVSFFRDLYFASKGDGVAGARLQRHRREAAVEIRALSSTDGVGGDFVPPVWMMNEWTAVARAARPIANLVNHLPLPANTDSINIPKVLTGSATAAQADAGAVQSTDPTTGALSVPVKTLAGQVDTSRQLLDRSTPGIDTILFNDLVADYNTKVDLQVILGSGTGANAKGILSDSNRVIVTFTSGSPTAAALYSKTADAIQQIGTNRFLPAQVIVMHPRRWGWLTAQADSSGRPLVVPSASYGSDGTAVNPFGTTQVPGLVENGPVGMWQGLPVYLDASIPTNQGAGTNEDVIFVLRPSDLYLWEQGTPNTRVYEEVLSGNLQVRFQVFGYFAFTSERYSKASATIGGTGLVAPTF